MSRGRFYPSALASLPSVFMAKIPRGAKGGSMSPAPVEGEGG